jgi:hypothetical protein
MFGYDTISQFAPDFFVTLFSLLIVGAFVSMLWYILWKSAFEPNPLVRDFFDLDLKKNKKENKLK